MKAFDWQRMALDKVPVEFLGEVALRSLYTFVLVFIFLKITGRRGVRQMSLFEVLIILTLGSAAGDVAFYDDVPLLPVLVVFVTLALLYRGIMWLMGHSEKLEDLLLLSRGDAPGLFAVGTDLGLEGGEVVREDAHRTRAFDAACGHHARGAEGEDGERNACSQNMLHVVLLYCEPSLWGSR